MIVFLFTGGWFGVRHRFGFGLRASRQANEVLEIRKGRWADAEFSAQEVVEAAERPVFIAVCNDTVGDDGSDAGQLLQLRRIGAVEVDQTRAGRRS